MPSWLPAAPTIQIRSTTCSAFPTFFAARSTCGRRAINMEMKIAAAHALAALAREDVPTRLPPPTARGRNTGPITSFRCRSIRGSFPTFRRRWPRRRWTRCRAAADRRHGNLPAAIAQPPRSDRRRVDRLYERLRRRPRRVVFAEGEEEQVIRAAASFVHQGLGSALLFGREDRVRETAKALGVELGSGIRSSTRRCRSATPHMPRTSTSGCSATDFCSAIAAPGQPGSQPFRRLHGSARRRRRHGDRRHPQFLRGARGRAALHRSQARPSRDGRVAGARARAHGAGRRYRGD